MAALQHDGDSPFKIQLYTRRSKLTDGKVVEQRAELPLPRKL
jgi:hypothetical protein